MSLHCEQVTQHLSLIDISAHVIMHWQDAFHLFLNFHAVSRYWVCYLRSYKNFPLLVSEAGCIIQMIMHSLFSAGCELWRSISSFLAIFRDAVMEIWRHLTRENINLLVALGIIMYAMPEFLDVLKDTMKKMRSRGDD